MGTIMSHCTPSLTDNTEHNSGGVIQAYHYVLNKLGAMASSETLDTHIVKVSAQHKQEGL